ncbi:MAG: hypothetical protein VX673_05800 [Pseudomonadota bacterium]|nr:hypothetical protein [Pseudomonadota bacterium]
MSDKPLDVYVLYATDAEQRFIKIADDGCLAIFDDEASAKRAKRRNPCTDYEHVNYYSQKQVDKMQADNEAEVQRVRELAEKIRDIAIDSPASNYMQLIYRLACKQAKRAGGEHG